MNTNRRVYVYGHVEEDSMDGWLEDKNYILSTSFREGSPNNVLEAMAKGIKPIIHNWPGAKEQFGKYVFTDIDDAVKMILNREYNSQEYRGMVEERFSVKNYSKLLMIIDEVLNE